VNCTTSSRTPSASWAIQAAAARRTLAPGQDAQHEALLDVERLGRQALDEMQRMLGVLRTGR
jgi:hypothetical protein